MTYEELLIEAAFLADSIPPKRKKNADIFIGRMQPLHQGHVNIIKKMNNPVILLVKGKKSSEDKTRNPFDTVIQTKLLKKVFNNIKIVVVETGYLPIAMSDLREMGLEVKTLFAGDDRLIGYKKQIDSINNKLDNDHKFNVQYKKTERFASATEVRETIKSGDKEKFKMLMPKELWSMFEELKQIMEK